MFLALMLPVDIVFRSFSREPCTTRYDTGEGRHALQIGRISSRTGKCPMPLRPRRVKNAAGYRVQGGCGPGMDMTAATPNRIGRCSHDCIDCRAYYWV